MKPSVEGSEVQVKVSGAAGAGQRDPARGGCRQTPVRRDGDLLYVFIFSLFCLASEFLRVRL